MKTGKIALLAAALFVAAGAVHAQTTTTTVTTVERQPATMGERFTYDSDDNQRFFANEFSIDLFGSWSDADDDNDIDDIDDLDDIDDIFDSSSSEDDTWGAGLGFNYFFTEMIGVGAHSTWNDNEGAFIDNFVVDALFRFPIDSISLAPYVLGGGGRIFEGDDRWEAHAGGGLEFRFNQYTGIFSDVRYIWVDETADGYQIRFGMRFAF
jgi:hypothetical protein